MFLQPLLIGARSETVKEFYLEKMEEFSQSKLLKKQKAIAVASPEEMEKLNFAAGSMGPKVQAAVNFARNTGKDAVIGSLSDIVDIVKGKAGTRITKNADHITYYD